MHPDPGTGGQFLRGGRAPGELHRDDRPEALHLRGRAGVTGVRRQRRVPNPGDRRVAGEPAAVPDALVRLSVGVEDVEDLWADLESLLATLTPS